MLTYQSESLVPLSTQTQIFSQIKMLEGLPQKFMFTLGVGAINWRSVKQSCITESTMEAKYVATSKAVRRRFASETFY